MWVNSKQAEMVSVPGPVAGSNGDPGKARAKKRLPELVLYLYLYWAYYIGCLNAAIVLKLKFENRGSVFPAIFPAAFGGEPCPH